MRWDPPIRGMGSVRFMIISSSPSHPSTQHIQHNVELHKQTSMAALHLSFLSTATLFPSSDHSATSYNPPTSTHLPRRGSKHRSLAGFNGDLLGDFGARDPFPAEIESNFCEKVLGNVNTEHKILIPNISALSLAQQDCGPVSPSQLPMSSDDARKLLLKVVGWRLVENDGGLRLQCLWKVRDFGCGVELVNRIARAVEGGGHYPNLHLENPNSVKAELWTSSIGGLCTNDFIVAAKIDRIKTSDLVPKKRIWA